MDFHQFYHLTWNYHTLILLDFNGRKVTFPYVPGFDISGTVAKLGEGVTSLAVGDEVRGGSLLVAIAGGIYIFLKSNGVFKRLWYLWKRKALHEWCIQYERDSQIQILKPNKSFGQVTQHCDSFEVAFEHSTIRIRQIGLRGSGPLWDLLQWLALRPRRWLCRVCRGAGWHGGQERWIVLQGPCWTSSCRHLEIRKWNTRGLGQSYATAAAVAVSRHSCMPTEAVDINRSPSVLDVESWNILRLLITSLYVLGVIHITQPCMGVCTLSAARLIPALAGIRKL